MICNCGCALDEHKGEGPCDLSTRDKDHLCGAYEAAEDDE